MPVLRFLGDVWSLAKPYWKSEEKWWARRNVALLLAIKFATIYVLTLQNAWYKDFYAAITARDINAFWYQAGVFAVIALVVAASNVYSHWIGWAIKTHWRSWMVRRYTADWLANRAYYRMQLDGETRAPDQRIGEDIGLFADRTLDLCVGFLDVATSLTAFTMILWHLSGSLHVGGYTIHGYMVWAVYAFTGLTSLGAHWLGHPLVKVFDDRSRLEAELRSGLIRVRENAETIAFYGGETVEERVIGDRWQAILANIWTGLRRERKLHWFTNGQTQIATVLPFLLAAPRFFNGEIDLGEVMQVAAAFGATSICLNWFISSYDSLARWMAETRRVKAFRTEIDTLHERARQYGFARAEAAGGVAVQGLTLNRPCSRPIVENFDCEIAAGRTVLLKGESGSGKSTMLRAIAGIWPFGSGTIAADPDAFFIPQSPYLPLGTLREAVCYPREPAAVGDPAQALEAVNLAHLVPYLDERDDWSHRLSGGEKQRVAFARVLLVKPSTVFLDEATSALDEANERLCYEILRTAPWRPTVVSIGHRSSLDQFHDSQLDLGMRRAA